jgi:hypothetical protein
MPPAAHSPSPFRDGFAALWHEPMLLPAELAWRWCFGFSALALGVLSFGWFLASLRVSVADEFLLRTLQPKLLDTAIQHIFRGSLNRFILQQTIVALGVILLWSLAATAGRSATLRRLIAMFRSEGDEETPSMQWDFAPIFALQLLRVMWTIIAAAVAGGLWFYGTVLAQNQRPLRAALVLSFGVGCACLAGAALNWYLGLAPLFCVRNGAGAMEALDQSLQFSGRHPGRLLLLGLGFFLLRLVCAGTMWLAFLSPLSFSQEIGPRWVALLMAAVVLVYLAGADLLRLARWGAYVSLAEDDSRPVLAAPPVIPPEHAAPSSIEPIMGLA